MSLDLLSAYEHRIDAEVKALDQKILSGQIGNQETYKAKCEERRALLRTVDMLKEVIAASAAREEFDG